MVGPIVREYDKRLWKKCIKCRGWHPRKDIVDDDENLIRKKGFGDHADSSDGLQSICYFCKNAANNAARNMNVTARIRHHTGTRCLTQLGKARTPPQFVTNLEDYLGYKIPTLVKALTKDLKEREGPKRKLRDALNEGYHIDHRKPLSSFHVVVGNIIDWDEFRACWEISNLSAIPADENLAKGAQYDEPSAKQDSKRATTASNDDSPDDVEGQEQAEEGEEKASEDVNIGITGTSGDPSAPD